MEGDDQGTHSSFVYMKNLTLYSELGNTTLWVRAVTILCLRSTNIHIDTP